MLLKYLLNIDNYNKYRSYLKIKEEDKELKLLYSYLDNLISKYDRTISFDEYKLYVLDKNPEYDTFLQQISEADIGEEFLKDSINEVVERALAYDLALVSIKVSEGRGELAEVFDMVSKFDNKSQVEDIVYVTDDLEELYDQTVHSKGLRWRLGSLNKSLGSLRKGDFGFIFARPEVGKTTFLASEISYFAEQTDRPILWINNEEQGNKVKIRCFQASLGYTLTELYSDREKSYNKYLETTNGNIKIYDSATINKRQVEKICKELQPGLIIFDQIDKIKGFDADRNDLRLGNIYIWARELAKSYCPVIGVCQSDVSGEGKKWLTMDNIAESKTTKAAEADFILGIGSVHDSGLEYVRYLHICKNKLSGDEDSDGSLRHGKFEVLIEPEVARYRDF